MKQSYNLCRFLIELILLCPQFNCTALRPINLAFFIHCTPCSLEKEKHIGHRMYLWDISIFTHNIFNSYTLNNNNFLVRKTVCVVSLDGKPMFFWIGFAVPIWSVKYSWYMCTRRIDKYLHAWGICTFAQIGKSA